MMLKAPPKLSGNLRSAAGSVKPRPTWQQQLRAAGYPESVLLLDFENYFEAGKDKYNLHELSTPEYLEDKRYEVLCLALKWNDRPAVCVQGEKAVEEMLRTIARQPGWEHVTVTMHNAPYDASVLARKYLFYPKFIIDTIGLSRFFNARRSHGLANLCKEHGLVDKGDTMEFSGCSNRYRAKPGKMKKGVPGPPTRVPPMTPEQRTKLAAYAINDAERQWELFKYLLPLLDNPAIELPLMQHTLEMFTKPSFVFNDAKAAEIVEQMYAAEAAAIPEGVERSDLCGPGSEEKFENLLTMKLLEARDFPMHYMKEGKEGKAFALAQEDPQRELLLNHPDAAVRGVVEARLAVKSWPNHISKVESMRAMARVSGDMLPIPLKYYGAHTGRWSGDEGINPQNMGSKSHALVCQVRETLTAGPGKKLVICDAAAVEARGLAWIAGQDDLTTKFRNGEEIYCGFASLVLGKLVRKPKKPGAPGYIEKVEKWFTWARNSIGKIGILGCIAEGTLIKTQAGEVPIEYVTADHCVWDGVRWVEHAGLVFRGVKRCVKVEDVWMTGDHEVLTPQGWYQAQDLSINSPKSAWFTESLPLLGSYLENEGGLSPSNAVAPAVECLLRNATIWSPENLHAVMCVLKRRLLWASHDTALLKSRTVQDFLTVFVQSLTVATRTRNRDTANEESGYTLPGGRIDAAFLNTWQDLKAGMIRVLKLTESTTMEITNPETCGSLLGRCSAEIEKTQTPSESEATPCACNVGSLSNAGNPPNGIVESTALESRLMPVYDILLAGPRRRYQAGSLIVANCGYGMGTDRIEVMGAGEITTEIAEKIKVTYRETNSMIVKFWADIERAFLHVAKYGQATKLGRWLTFDRTDYADVRIQLPNGRHLHYPKVRVEKNGYGGDSLRVFNEKKHTWDYLWGGTLTENVVQGFCRDLLAEAILRLAEKWCIPLHCHDEVVVLTDECSAAQALADAIAEISRTPTWAEGLPLSAEGSIVDFYQK